MMRDAPSICMYLPVMQRIGRAIVANTMPAIVRFTLSNRLSTSLNIADMAMGTISTAMKVAGTKVAVVTKVAVTGAMEKDAEKATAMKDAVAVATTGTDPRSGSVSCAVKERASDLPLTGKGSEALSV